MKFLKICFAIALVSQALIAGETIPVLSETMTKEEWQNFAKISCGYFPIPEELKVNLPRTMELAETMGSTWADSPLFSREEKQQLEALFFEKQDWAQMPTESQNLADEMGKIGVRILSHVLNALDINPDYYPHLAIGLGGSEAKYLFKVIHYDSSKNCIGVDWHKDLRWVTLIFAKEEGLQVKINDEIFDAKPRDGYFFINLGVYFEAFINDTTKLNACVHQVTQRPNDRNSIGLFLSAAKQEEGFYQLDGEGLTWKGRECLDNYLVKDKNHSFTIPQHAVFSDVK